MESLFEGEYVCYNVIDAWAELLNYFEKDRDINSSPYRLFCKVQMTVSYSHVIITTKMFFIHK